MTSSNVYRTAEAIYAMLPANGIAELRRVVNAGLTEPMGSRDHTQGLDFNARLLTALGKLNQDRGTTPCYTNPTVVRADEARKGKRPFPREPF